jgi:hypothetical protein
MSEKCLPAAEHPCDLCPWRKANQGKRTPWGFYAKKNLRRLWNQIRSGLGVQTCHPTDPSHPDHIAAGAKPGATLRECSGSVILVIRELLAIKGDAEIIGPEEIDAYWERRCRGLTRTGILEWLVQRASMAGVPYIGGRQIPKVDIDDAAVDLPEFLKK